MSTEFKLIADYFAPLAGPEGLSLQDDAALFHPAKDKELVVTKDLLVENTHFFEGSQPFQLAQKALAVNLSDIAAKGARPRCYFLGLALPKETQEGWFKEFSEGLKYMQAAYGLTLAGGDTTATNGPIVISITLIGEVSRGQMIHRHGAKIGDAVFVTGTLGDAALGLQAMKSGQCTAFPYLEKRYLVPEPRVKLAAYLYGIASASADISDGLLADAGHIAKASDVGIMFDEACLPISMEAGQYLAASPSDRQRLWSGGDDYEVVFTAPDEKAPQIEEVSRIIGVPITRIGHVNASKNVCLIDPAGKLVHCETVGYMHFK